MTSRRNAPIGPKGRLGLSLGGPVAVRGEVGWRQQVAVISGFVSGQYEMGECVCVCVVVVGGRGVFWGRLAELGRMWCLA